MKNVSLVLLLLFLSFGVFAQDSGDEAVAQRHHMKWNISGTMDSTDRQFCVEELVTIKVMNHNTGRPLPDAQVRIYYGLDRIDTLMTGPSGIVVFTPNQTGVYKLFMRKVTYWDEKANFNVTECPGSRHSTTTTTSNVSGAATSTTESSEETVTIAAPETTGPEESSVSTQQDAVTTQQAPATTSETSVTSLPEPAAPSITSAVEGSASEGTCTDDIRNQGEAGVDCGGPCNVCPAKGGSGLGMVALVFAGVVIVGIVFFFLLKGGRGVKAVKGKEKEEEHKHHHKAHREKKTEGAKEV